ncbi:YciI family protein [Nocardioides sp. GCM10027113]|uniref:YciI family protein n=1 Tax=unclassified Nocardioides TaxID=2615069 RepID=UPI00360AB453
MAKFMFIYHAPAMPTDAPAPSPEEMQEVMQAWMRWGEKVGDGMVDFGTPLAGGVRVTPDGTSDSDREVAGYTIIEAADRDAALALAQVHPHLDMPGGCTIEVHECQPVPGM